MEEALRNADSVNELRLKIKLESKANDSGKITDGLDHLSLVAEQVPEDDDGLVVV